MNSFLYKIKLSLDHLATHTGVRFVLEATFLAFLLKLVGYFPTYYFFEFLGINEIFDKMIQMQVPEPDLIEFAFAILFAPFVETFFGQMLPIKITQIFTDSKISWIFISAMVFSLFHIPAIAFLPSAFLMGLLLSWVFVVKSAPDWKMGYLYTFAVHLLHNAISVLFILLPLFD